MADTLRAACVQITSSPDILENLDKVAYFVREAASQGATFIATPENTCHLRHPSSLKRDSVKTQDEHIGISFFSDLSKDLGVTLLIGSMAIKPESGKLLNRSFVFNPEGRVAQTYDKIHLFDVDLPKGESYRESDIMQAGKNAVTHALNDDFQLGLSICYDLRFPHLYRDLAKLGANILCMPAAFTVPTGRAHWEVLLRARAIETGSYVMAPAQVGEHEGGRKTYGHSMIIDPWGAVLDVLENDEGFIVSDLRLDKIQKARNSVPSLHHDKAYNI